MNGSAQTMRPWGPEKKLHWFLKQSTKRSYEEDVLSRIDALRKANGARWTIEEYGRLTINPEKYPLYAIRFNDKTKAKPHILITGGIHGYETSGVKGALTFLERHAEAYAKHFNLVVAPCISPWSYETINRLNPVMENPNREFKPDGKSEESRLLMDYLGSLDSEFDAHIDLHETTDSDRTFLPEEYAKNGKHLDAKDVDIPDGFYLIATEDRQRPDLERAMIDSVRKVTHIAKPDQNGRIYDRVISMEGVIHINIPGLCAQFTAAKSRYGAFTTEMYPDSPRFKTQGVERVEAICSEAQVACVIGALDFWKNSAP